MLEQSWHLVHFIPHSKNITHHNMILIRMISHTSLYQGHARADIHLYFDIFRPPNDNVFPIKIIIAPFWTVTFIKPLIY